MFARRKILPTETFRPESQAGTRGTISFRVAVLFRRSLDYSRRNFNLARAEWVCVRQITVDTGRVSIIARIHFIANETPDPRRSACRASMPSNLAEGIYGTILSLDLHPVFRAAPARASDYARVHACAGMTFKTITLNSTLINGLHSSFMKRDASSNTQINHSR